MYLFSADVLSKRLLFMGVFVLLTVLVVPVYASDYYVRPSGDSYGSGCGTTKNGSSYCEAWEGFDNITWGTGGVTAGDTLYVCGTHYDTFLEIQASGTSGNIITITGDCTDPGVIIGAKVKEGSRDDVNFTETSPGSGVWESTGYTKPCQPVDCPNYYERVPGWIKLSSTMVDGVDCTASDAVVSDNMCPLPVVNSSVNKIWWESNKIKMTVDPSNYSTIIIPNQYVAIYAEDRSYVDIEDITIKHVKNHGIWMIDVDHFNVYNATVTNFGGGANESYTANSGNGIMFDGDSSYGKIENSYVSQGLDVGLDLEMYSSTADQEAYEIEFNNNVVEYCGGGIAISAHEARASEIHDVTVKGNTFRYIGQGWAGSELTNSHGKGISIKEYNGSPHPDVYDISIIDNHIDTYTWFGINMWEGDAVIKGNLIENGTADYDGSEFTDPAGILIHGGDYGVETSGDYEGYSAYEVTAMIENNVVVNNEGHGIFIVNNTPKPSEGYVEIYHNTFYNNGSNDGEDDLPTIYSTTSKGTIIKNNILYAIDTPFFQDVKGGSSWTGTTAADYNIFYSENNNGEWIWGTTSYTTLSSYTTASGNDTNSDSLSSGPLFVDKANGRFDIDQYDTQVPATDAGTTVTLSDATDYCGHAIPTGSGPDIGAFEGLCDLVIHFPMDEGSGSVVNDLSGYDNDPTVSGDSAWVTGKVGDYARDFDGNGDYLSVDNVPLWDDQGFTISAWVKPDGTHDDYAPIMFKWTGGIRFINGANKNKVQFTLYNANNQYKNVVSTSALSNDVWTKVTAVYDEDDDKMFLYINGTLNNTLTSVGGLSADYFDGTKSFSDIGGNSAGTRMFSGSIDDIRVYNSAYSSTVIGDLYDRDTE